MSAVRAYSVAVTITGGDRSTLLRLVSTMHRRGVDVLEAELARPAHGRRTFAATFLATPQHAPVVAASLRGLVEVLGVQLCEADLGVVVPIDAGLSRRGPRASAETTERAAR